MSFTDQEAEPVQPEGQGGEGTGGGSPWADLLDRTPEDSRELFESRFRDWDANYTRTSQELADAKKQWEGIDRQQVDAAFQLLSDPEAARNWLDQQYGPLQAAQPEPAAPDPFTGFEDPSQQQFEQLLKSQLGPLQQRLEEYDQRWQQMEQQAQVEQIQSQIDAEISTLAEQHGKSLPEGVDIKDVVERYGSKYADAGANPKEVVARAWGDFQAHLNAIEKAVLQSKVDAPKPAEGGGVPDVTPTQHRRVKDAAVDAEEFLRNMNRQ